MNNNKEGRGGEGRGGEGRGIKREGWGLINFLPLKKEGFLESGEEGGGGEGGGANLRGELNRGFTEA